LTDQQAAEVKRFIIGDFDVVLGMLERRLDGLQPRGPGTYLYLLRVNVDGDGQQRRALSSAAYKGGSVLDAQKPKDVVIALAFCRKMATARVGDLPGQPQLIHQLPPTAGRYANCKSVTRQTDFKRQYRLGL
jgi:hypothetical protein